MIKNGTPYQISIPEGRALYSSNTWKREFSYSDHLGNTRVSFRASGDTLQKVGETAFDPWGVVLRGAGFVNGTSNRFEMQGKEKEATFGLNIINFGARVYNPTIGRFDRVDPLAEKILTTSVYSYSKNNPLNMIDKDGRYAVSVHYNITYKTLRSLGYSREKADLIAHYSSTYADHPERIPFLMDHIGHAIGESGNQSLMYRRGIDYNKTRESQDEKNSMWHSMMSNEKAENGRTEKDAMLRGLKFGWDNIFAQENGEDLGKLGQGLHALQDAMAHKGMKTKDHLGFDISSIKQTLYKDMYGSTKEAETLTESAMIIVDLLNGKKANLKDGDKLTLTGMSTDQLRRTLNLLYNQGFEGRINTE